MYKAVVFFDLDQTLLNDEKQVPPENVKALKALEANDVLPVIATGRSYYELADIMAATGIRSAITANGGDVFLNGEHIFQSVIGEPQLVRFLNATAAQDIQVAMYSSEASALTGYDQLTTDNYAQVHQTPPPINPKYYQEAALSLLLIFLPWNQTGDQLGKQFIQDFPELTFYRNSHFSFDVVNHGISKGSGMSVLLNQPALRGVPTYAFGDGYNDIPLLQAADTGIAMGNAYPKVAAIADYQTDDYRKNGIPNALAHFNLI
ncbi:MULTISPECIES: Cof-type HAD-IIB family hydrolase [Lacticaseibacillus]|uniref:Cof-type HAD-IIB family hydrolase n=2 Tax=Lacticaseibacillus zeae TaxID=57037 RepID=A0A5R8LR73_LACZE|nr:MULTISPECIES: Cof-type HAD-IIB family hydrolase [Lacticaseibacillus]OFR98357.1 HAD family hydrolase [Lactobacillus sp. HMSC068F07]KLI75472.1 HAD family hydrolase [Lacticaseibacillus casei]MDE3316817.1 Cof-type HAD-IIB family hydrolase [Lacticaseibacillus zeae]TLF39727.1 Cof-type HAD-IIB family hydrolase [Lacticaseibacillus zeae]WLV83602.1 Cof-type HAD-IIB family hydrolase [Lacticaseibacillus sp. NCIMB 15475]